MDWKYFSQPIRRQYFCDFYKLLLCVSPKKKLSNLFFETQQRTYQTYQDKFYVARYLYSVLAIVNSVSQYAFLCCEVSCITSLNLFFSLDSRRRGPPCQYFGGVWFFLLSVCGCTLRTLISKVLQRSYL